MKSILYFLIGFSVSALILTLAYYAIHGTPQITTGQVLWCTLAFIISVPTHEFIHGVTSCYVSENNCKTITFGIKPLEFRAYCKYALPIDPQMRKYVIIMPCVILAVVPAIAGLLLGSPSLCIFSIFSFAGSSKDIHNYIKITNKKK